MMKIAPRALHACVIGVLNAALAAVSSPALAQGPELFAGSRTFTVRENRSQMAGVRTTVAFPRLSFDRPLYIAAPPDGTDRLFVLEQDGRVRVFANNPDAARAEVALDISDKVHRGHNEEGLLGLAFDPAFAENGYVYLHYSANGPRRGVVSRFTMDDARRKILPDSESIVLEQSQPYGNHKGGMLEFGPDGYLYLSFGDGGSAGDPHRNGQDLGSWLAKILRIDVGAAAATAGAPYVVPADNPFVDTAGARPEIWAYGLRNVWRFSFDRKTGALWAGDVGQDQWEEVDLIVRGGNYGWNRREGAYEYRRGPGEGPFLDPILEYTRLLARSITGGYVYRGAAVPELEGAYVHGDYVTGFVWAAWWDGEQIQRHQLIGLVPSVSSFGEDQDGEILATSLDGKIFGFVSQRGR
jgi:glucose/arabinose dehydrogenase